MGDVLVVTSKVKKMIKEKAGFNTSATLVEALSNKVVLMCETAIEKAKADGRKTVMDRDLE
jgi:histone H3/H4